MRAGLSLPIKKSNCMSNKLPAFPACASERHPPAGRLPKSPAAQLDQIKMEAQKTAQDMRNYARAQQAEFVASTESWLAGIKRDLDQLLAKFEAGGNAARAEAESKIRVLRDRSAKLNKRLEEARHASGSAWGGVKAGFKQDCLELKDGFRQARQWASDKIAP